MIIRNVHRWLGLVLCASILLISFTGVLLVWKKEYLWLSIPQARENLQIDTASLAQSIEKVEQSYSGNQLSFIQLHSENLALHKAYLDGGRAAWHDQRGVKLQEWAAGGRFEDWLVNLHRRFLIAEPVGSNMVGFSGLLMIPLLLLGLTLWWPRRASLKKGVLPRSSVKAEIIRSHSNLGAIGLLPMLVIVITGVILVYPTQSRELLQAPFTDDSPKQEQQGPVDSLVGSEHSSWLRVIERSRSQYPNAKIRWLSPASQYSEFRIVGLQQQGGWNRSGQTSIYVDAEGGRMDRSSDEFEKTTMERAINFTYPLHTGKLSIGYRLLLTGGGLIMVLISVFGLIAYTKKY